MYESFDFTVSYGSILLLGPNVEKYPEIKAFWVYAFVLTLVFLYCTYTCTFIQKGYFFWPLSLK